MSEDAESTSPKRSLWPVVEAVTNLFTRAYMLARTRAASHPSPLVRLLAGRDHIHYEQRLLQREADVLRAQRASLKSHKRPEYGPAQRAEILHLMILRGWSVNQAADRFVVHANTIRSWKQAVNEKARGDRLLGRVPWNKLHDGVRWLVHEIRRLCPEREFGTRTIAQHIVQAGIRISDSSVRRILDEEPPKPGKWANRPTEMPIGAEPRDLLRPTERNRVWHTDLTVIRLLWLRLSIAAVVDGFSRKIIALRAYRGAPTSRDMTRFIRRSARRHGRPRFVITDHGCQFRRAFRRKLEAIGATHVRGRVRSFGMNGKVERLFRTFRLWQRTALLLLGPKARQRQLDAFRDWYNEHRPHSALRGNTPQQVWDGNRSIAPTRLLARGGVQPTIRLARRHVRGDPKLPIIEIDVTLRRAA